MTTIEKLKPTKKMAVRFDGTVIHVCADNPKFLLLSEVTQYNTSGKNRWKIDVGDGIWVFRDSKRLGNIQEGFEVSVWGRTELGNFGGQTEYLIKTDDFYSEVQVTKAFPPPEEIFDQVPKFRFKGAVYMESGMTDFPAEEVVGPREIQQGMLDENDVFMSTEDAIRKCDYLIVGEGGDPDWKFGSYGTKIAIALDLKRQGAKVKIVKAKDFWEQATSKRRYGSGRPFESA